MNIKHGPDYELEKQADELLIQDRKDRGLFGIAVQDEEYSWLSDDQLKLREGKEIANRSGVADPAIQRGMFFRAHNPMMGIAKRPDRHSPTD